MLRRTLSPLLALLAFLAGCDQVQNVIDQFPRPSTAIINGYTVERDASGNPTGNVNLNVSALDGSGEPVGGNIENLQAGEVNVIEPAGLSAQQRYTARAEVKFDITVQEIINAVLDIDQSGSMEANDPERRRVDAAKSFIGRITSQDRVAVMTFRGNDPNFRASTLLQDFTSDKGALEAAVEKVGQEGGTPIWDSTLDTIDLHERDTGGADDTRVVLLFTDGERDGGQVDFATALDEARASGIKFFTVGLSKDADDIDTGELQKLADETGGTFSNVGDPDRLEELFNKAFNAIRASGVITLNITPVPPAGSVVEGNISFDVNGESFNLPYLIQL